MLLYTYAFFCKFQSFPLLKHQNFDCRHKKKNLKVDVCFAGILNWLETNIFFLIKIIFVINQLKNNAEFTSLEKNSGKICKKWHFTHTHTHTHTHIYIFTNLLTKSTYGDRQKEKNPPEFGDKTISRITVRRKKKKKYREKKKEKAILVTPIEKKIKRYTIGWSKEKKTTVKCCEATITKSAQYWVEQNSYKNYFVSQELSY